MTAWSVVLTLAEEQALRGYGAVHLATAERIQTADAVLISGDAQLCRAARKIGFAVSRLQRWAARRALRYRLVPDLPWPLIWSSTLTSGRSRYYS